MRSCKVSKKHIHEIYIREPVSFQTSVNLYEQKHYLNTQCLLSVGERKQEQSRGT